jgi:sugar phosphate isomerase/epimerase
MDAFADRIVSTHVSDNDLILDRHIPIGDGKIDFKRVFRNLMKIGFKGTLNIELPQSNEDRALSKKRLEPILDELGILKEALTP